MSTSAKSINSHMQGLIVVTNWKHVLTIMLLYMVNYVKLYCFKQAMVVEKVDSSVY